MVSRDTQTDKQSAMLVQLVEEDTALVVKESLTYVHYTPSLH